MTLFLKQIVLNWRFFWISAAVTPVSVIAAIYIFEELNLHEILDVMSLGSVLLYVVICFFLIYFPLLFSQLATKLKEGSFKIWAYVLLELVACVLLIQVRGTMDDLWVFYFRAPLPELGLYILLALTLWKNKETEWKRAYVQFILYHLFVFIGVIALLMFGTLFEGITGSS